MFASLDAGINHHTRHGAQNLSFWGVVTHRPPPMTVLPDLRQIRELQRISITLYFIYVTHVKFATKGYSKENTTA